MRHVKSRYIPFGQWAPDLPNNTPGFCNIASNVISHGTYYTPMSAYEPLGTGLSARVLSGFSATDDESNTSTFCGTATKLYQYDFTSNSWDDVTRSSGGDYNCDESYFWSFVQWGNYVIAANLADKVQIIQVGDTNFTDMITSTRQPRARYVTTVKDFVFLGNTWDSTDGYKPNRVWWSAVGDETDFDPDVSTQSDYQDLPQEYGEIMGVFGGENVIIVQKRAITIAQYIGGGSGIFRFDTVEVNRGMITPGGAVRLGDALYYIDDTGFMRFQGGVSTPIGVNRVDRYFFTQTSQGDMFKTRCAVDLRNKLIVWLVDNRGNSQAANLGFNYNFVTDSWSESDNEGDTIFSSYSEGLTLEDLDYYGTMETLPYSLDSSAWKGGDRILAIINAAGQLGYRTGSTVQGHVISNYVELEPGYICSVNRGELDLTGASPSSIEVLHKSHFGQFASATSSGLAQEAAELGRTYTGRCTNRIFAAGSYFNAGGGYTTMSGATLYYTVRGTR